MIISVLRLLPLPHYAVQNPTIKRDLTLKQISEGKRIALTICVRCHYNEKTGTLSGRRHANPKHLGLFSSGNITQDSTGIGNWSSGQLFYFLKTGIKPNGEYVFDMPKYPNLSEEDLLSIIAFLQSEDELVRKTYMINPEPKFSMLTKLLLQTILRPPAYEKSKVYNPDTNNLLMMGKYLATAKFSCYECHSFNTVTNNYNFPDRSWNFFKGGNPHVNEQYERIYSPDITGDTVKGIGKWNEDEFIKTLKNGIKPNGNAIRDPMFPFPLLTDKEAKAIYIYLKTLQ